MIPSAAIILAAGKGTRMRSDLPKVAHEVAGAPMVQWVADACEGAGCGRIVVVVGHRQEVVRAIFEHRAAGDASIEFAVQEQQLGTGHAVRSAEPLLNGFEGDILVLAGDGPLIRPETLADLIERRRQSGAACVMATAVIDDPAGYGRIVRSAKGEFEAIVEEKNATPAQKVIREVNPSIYCFDAAALFAALADVKRNEASGEYYITDVPGLLLARGKGVDVVDALPPEDVLSINTPEQLEEVGGILQRRAASAHTRA